MDEHDLHIPQISEGHWQQDVSDGSRLALIRQLPVGVLHEMSRALSLHLPESHLRMTDTREEVVGRAMLAGSPTRLVAEAIKAIVRRSSMWVELAKRAIKKEA